MLHLGQNNFLFSSEKSAVGQKEKGISKKLVQKSSGRWTKEEHQRFVDGLKKFGKNWKLIEESVGTRNGAQVRSHAQKFFNRLGKDFDMKCQENDLQSENKLKEKFRKTSGSSLDTADSYSGAGNQDMKSSQASPIDMSPIIAETSPGDLKSVDSTKLVPASGLFNKALGDSEKVITMPNEPVEEVVESKRIGSLPLFDLLMLKFKICNNEIFCPKLSDIVNISTGPKFESDFEIPEPAKSASSVYRSSFQLYKKPNLKEAAAPANTKALPSNINNFDTLGVDALQKKIKTN